MSEEINEIIETEEVVNELPFVIAGDGALIFDEDFVITDEIVDSSKYLFETPLLKPYVSKFTTGANKNITMANIFKLCVILGCSPNDLFDWEEWRGRIMAKMATKKDYLLTHSDIKEML